MATPDETFVEIVVDAVLDEIEAEARKHADAKLAEHGKRLTPVQESAFNVGVIEGAMATVQVLARLGWLKEGIVINP